MGGLILEEQSVFGGLQCQGDGIWVVGGVFVGLSQAPVQQTQCHFQLGLRLLLSLGQASRQDAKGSFLAFGVLGQGDLGGFVVVAIIQEYGCGRGVYLQP